MSDIKVVCCDCCNGSDDSVCSYDLDIMSQDADFVSCVCPVADTQHPVEIVKETGDKVFEY